MADTRSSRAGAHALLMLQAAPNTTEATIICLNGLADRTGQGFLRRVARRLAGNVESVGQPAIDDAAALEEIDRLMALDMPFSDALKSVSLRATKTEIEFERARDRIRRKWNKKRGK